MRSVWPTWTMLVLVLTACGPARDVETTRTGSDTMAGAADRPAAADQAATPARTGNAKLDDALSAAPASVTEQATVMDWPEKAGGQPKELRRGTNGWTCFPSTPRAVGAAGKDPMCLDKQFMSWAEALMSRKPPRVNAVGIGYMLQGDAGASNTDPYAKSPTSDNQWVQTGPHLMVVVPGTAQLAGLPTDPKSGGPWIMWKGTPYAHVMAPVR
jgi:hypothetical protein